MKFQSGEITNEYMVLYFHESLCFEIREIDTGIDLNYIAISCTNLKMKKLL